MAKPTTRKLKTPWPFPVSVLANGQTVRNLPPAKPKPRPLPPVPPPGDWKGQDALF